MQHGFLGLPPASPSPFPVPWLLRAAPSAGGRPRSGPAGVADTFFFCFPISLRTFDGPRGLRREVPQLLLSRPGRGDAASALPADLGGCLGGRPGSERGTAGAKGSGTGQNGAKTGQKGAGRGGRGRRGAGRGAGRGQSPLPSGRAPCGSGCVNQAAFPPARPALPVLYPRRLLVSLLRCEPRARPPPPLRLG